MLDIQLITTAISIGFVFILFVTGAYKKSISTIIYILSLFVSMQFYQFNNKDAALITILVGAGAVLARSILNTKKDNFIKR